MADTTCINLTEAARSVQLFKINGFTATKERRSIASRIWTVGGRDWQIDYIANAGNEYPYCNDGWIKFRLSLVSRASGVAASFSCRLVHPEPSSYQGRRPQQDKMASSVFHQYSFVEVAIMKRNDLESSGYVKDESFVVQCAINVLHREQKSATAADAVSEPCSDLQKDLGELLRSQKGADITFHVSGESIAAHRCVLAARSPVFKAKISQQMKEKKALQCVEIKDMEAEVFKAMLHFIYTDTLPELDNCKQGEHETAMARHLLEAADQYGLARLKAICEEKMCTSISVDTVATALALAEQHRCSELRATCMKFILSHVAHFQDIAATEGYKHLEASCPKVLTDLLKLMVRQGHKLFDKH